MFLLLVLNQIHLNLIIKYLIFNLHHFIVILNFKFLKYFKKFFLESSIYLLNFHIYY